MAMEAQQIIQLAVGIAAIVSFILVNVRWNTSQLASARAEMKAEVERVKAEAAAAIAQAEQRLKAGIDSEAKSRHDFVNNMHTRLAQVDTAISRQGERFDLHASTMARREEVVALEQRVIARMDKSDGKLDRLMETMSAMSAMFPSLEKKIDMALSSRLTEAE